MTDCKSKYQPYKKCFDHLGNCFSSVREMCNFHGIKVSTYYGRKQKNWSLEEILSPDKFSAQKRTKADERVGATKKMKNGLIATVVKYIDRDHIEVEFENGEKCTSTTYSAFERGYIKPDHGICDHLGNYYPSISSMARAYNLSHGALLGRLKQGWDLKDALTIPSNSTESKRYHRKSYFVFGEEYHNFEEITKRYGVSERKLSSLYKTGGGEAIEEYINQGAYQYSSAPVVSRIGEEKRMNCGFKAKITKYNSAHDISVEFEDGEQVHTYYKSFIQRKIAHPFIKKKNRWYTYHGIEVKLIYSDENKSLYECHCTRCEHRGLESAEWLIAHAKSCKNQ